MASIHKYIPIDAHPDEVWDAVRDFGAVHRRLVPGFVLDARLDGDARIVTFANGTVARELLPHEIGPYIDSQMDQATLAMQKTLARSAKSESVFASDRASKA